MRLMRSVSRFILRKKSLLFFLFEPAREQELLEAEQGRDGVADLVREPRREAPDGGEALGANEPLLRARELRGEARGLVDLRAQPLLVGAQRLGHPGEAVAELAELARAFARHLELARALGDAGGGAREALDRIDHEARHRDVREHEERERENSHVEAEQPDERRARDGARHARARQARDREEEREEREHEQGAEGDEELQPNAGSHAAERNLVAKNWAQRNRL